MASTILSRGPSAQDIARAAGASISLINYHFGNRECLMETAVGAARARTEAQLQQLDPPYDHPIDNWLADVVRQCGMELRMINYPLATRTATAWPGLPRAIVERCPRLLVRLRPPTVQTAHAVAAALTHASTQVALDPMWDAGEFSRYYMQVLQNAGPPL